MTQPEFALYGLDGDWLIENLGVDPDIVVDNRPDLVMKGQDPQLEKGCRAGDKRDPGPRRTSGTVP
jgi:tricorn protease